jgi:hypothetical protein
MFLKISRDTVLGQPQGAAFLGIFQGHISKRKKTVRYAADPFKRSKILQTHGLYLCLDCKPALGYNQA